ncbi:MAG: HEAT repeat domain-containing protein [Cyanobacteria bacterium J06638_22]
MTKDLTIELPENLSERLGALEATNDAFLKDLILQPMQLLATSMQSLQDESPDIRAKAARTLGFIGTEIAVSTLGQALHDRDLVVRQAAAEALRQIGTEPALSLLSQRSPSYLAGESTTSVPCLDCKGLSGVD